MITMSSFKYAGLIISIIISLISCTHNKNYPTAFQPELAKAEAMMYRYPPTAHCIYYRAYNLTFLLKMNNMPHGHY